MSALDTDTCNLLMFPDLFYSVLDHFYPHDPVESQALVALAQTCRAFSEPSLDRLWRRLISLRPLIRCYTTADQVDNPITPTSSQFATIDRYAHRVRQVVIYDSPSVRFLECTSTHPSVLLPNLTTLEWKSPFSHPVHAPIAIIQKLLSPSLVSLNVSLIEVDVPTFLSFFDTYPFLDQNLKSLEIRFSDGLHSVTITQALSRAICNQTGLEKASLGAPIDDGTLRYLSTLPTLKTLRVSLPERSQAETPSNSPTDPPFCNVEDLQFTSTDLNLVTSLLRPDQMFRTFCLNYHARMTSDAAGALFNVLASRSNTEPLDHLTLKAGDLNHPLSVDEMATEAPRHRLTYTSLKPLMVFGSLRRLAINWSEQIALEDAQLADLARSWPLLETCYLDCTRGSYLPFSVTYPTLGGLLALATACPRLTSVCLPIDATQIPAVNVVAPCPHIDTLVFPESPIDDALPVAEFLYAHFPSLSLLDRRFMSMPGTDTERMWAYERGWAQVEVLLEEFDTGAHFELASVYSDEEEGEVAWEEGEEDVDVWEEEGWEEEGWEEEG